MSAFIVSDEHITALAAYAARHRLCVMHDGKAHSYYFDDVAKLGTILHAENVKSVNYRYDEDEPTDFAVSSWAEFRKFSPLQIIKAAQCLEYQSCEHPGWESSLACTIVRAIISEAIGELPGYDAADWEITEVAARAAAV